MRINISGLALIKEFEGLYLRSYLCPAGVWTIGYGTTKGVRLGMKITKEQAEQMLVEELQECEDIVFGAVKVSLNENEFAALVSFVYNVGGGALRKSTLLRKLNAGDRMGAANEFLRWVYGGGRVLKGLVRRREAEKELFLTPVNA